MINWTVKVIITPFLYINYFFKILVVDLMHHMALDRNFHIAKIKIKLQTSIFKDKQMFI